MPTENRSTNTESIFEEGYILPFENISKAQEIREAIHLQSDQLKPLLEIGKTILKKYPTIKILPFNLLTEKAGVGELKRVIYFPKIYSGLLIDPFISQQYGKIISFEKLETMNHDTLGAFVNYAKMIFLTSYQWEPGPFNFNHDVKLVRDKSISGIDSTAVENAVNILNGHLFTPSQVIDFSNFDERVEEGKNVMNFFKSEIKNNPDCHKWIVNRNNQLIIVDDNGKYLEDTHI